MNILLIINTEKESCFLSAKEIITLLSSYPCRIFIDSSTGLCQNSVCDCSEVSLSDGIDLAITVGGDGTLLHAAELLSRYKIPVLGINQGRLGYLTELETTELDLLPLLFQGKLKTEERMMLDFEVHRNGVKVDSFTGLNDGVISKGALPKLLELELYCDKSPITTYRADGLVVSTPTGSTAYSLSAGGPVIAPGLQLIGVTPICAHSISTRPIIFGSDVLLSLKIPVQRLDDIYLSVDGDNTFPLAHHDEILIKKSSRTLKTIKLKDNNFYHTLNAKFSGGIKP